MMKLFPKKSKKGITLVESVIAVVVLGIFAVGVLSLLTSGGVKILQISNESAAYSEATQRLDMVISAVSNGSTNYIIKTDTGSVTTCDLSISGLKTVLGFNDETDITAVISLYDTSEDPTVTNVRGWYLTLTYQGATVTGFASNSEGVFD